MIILLTIGAGLAIALCLGAIAVGPAGFLLYPTLAVVVCIAYVASVVHRLAAQASQDRHDANQHVRRRLDKIEKAIREMSEGR